MKPLFKQAQAETYDEFLQLVRGWKLVFSYVYTGPTTADLSFDLPDAESGERYVAFNLANHGEAAQKRFREVSMIEVRLGDPPLRPLPYWGSFVVGMGPIQTVYSNRKCTRDDHARPKRGSNALESIREEMTQARAIRPLGGAQKRTARGPAALD